LPLLLLPSCPCMVVPAGSASSSRFLLLNRGGLLSLDIPLPPLSCRKYLRLLTMRLFLEHTREREGMRDERGKG
jgi:hypothetical protein